MPPGLDGAAVGVQGLAQLLAAAGELRAGEQAPIAPRLVGPVLRPPEPGEGFGVALNCSLVQAQVRRPGGRRTAGVKQEHHRRFPVAVVVASLRLQRTPLLALGGREAYLHAARVTNYSPF